MSAPSQSSENSPSLPAWLARAPLILVLLTIVLHLPSVMDSGWVVDDTRNLSQHANDGDIAGEWTTPTYAHAGGDQGHIWRPLPASLQHLAARIFGREPAVFRGLNLGLHLLNLGLLSLWIRRRSSAVVTGLLVTLWATHATLTEAISWSSDIYDLAACSIALLMLWGLDRAKSTAIRCGIVGLGVLGACLCKESSVALVGLVWIMLWLQPPKNLSKRGRIPIGGAALAGAAAWHFWHGQVTIDSYDTALASTPIAHQVQAWFEAMGWLLIPPNRAWFAHMFTPGPTLEFIVGVSTITALLAATWALYRQGKPEARVLGLATAAWAGLLVPAGVGMALIGIQPLRYTYLPLAIFIGLLAGATPLIRTHGRFCLIAAMFLSGTGILLSWMRIPNWQNDRTLYSAELNREPENAWALRGLGRALIGENQAEQGVNLWRMGVDSNPEGIRLFVVQDERYLLATTAVGLALEERLSWQIATELAISMTERMVAEHREHGTSMPEDFCLLFSSLPSTDVNDHCSSASSGISGRTDVPTTSAE